MRNQHMEIRKEGFAALSIVLAVALAFTACARATPDYQRSLGGPGLTATPTATATPTPTRAATLAPTQQHTPLPTPGAPFAPLKLVATVEEAEDELTVTLVWLAYSNNVTSFVVERSDEGETGPWQELAILPANSAKFVDRGLSRETVYFYRMKARNSFGDSAYSHWVSTVDRRGPESTMPTTSTLTPTPMTPVLIPEAQAVATAVERAQFCGLKGDPTAVRARYMTLGEYCELAGCGGPNPETPVWVVSLRTYYEDRCPEPLPCPIELYVVVVDAGTGRVITTSASCHANDSLFPVP